MTCRVFSIGPVHIVENQIIPLALYGRQEVASQKQPDAIEPFKCLAQGLIQHALHHGKKVYVDRGSFFWQRVAK